MTKALRSRTGRRWLAAMLAALCCTALTTYGPVFVAWCKPEWMGKAERRVFSVGTQDLDVATTSGPFAWLGYERVEATPLRSISVMYAASTRASDAELAAQVREADVELIGPSGENTLGRTGLIFHRHRAGFPFAAVESSVCVVFGENPRFDRVRGGSRIETNSAPYVRLAPWGVRPAGLLGNIGFWTLVCCGPMAVAGWRRARRRKAGLCVACGYDRRGSPAGPCPECGDPASAREGA